MFAVLMPCYAIFGIIVLILGCLSVEFVHNSAVRTRLDTHILAAELSVYDVCVIFIEFDYVFHILIDWWIRLTVYIG